MAFTVGPNAQYEKKKTDKVALIDADRYKHIVVNEVYKNVQNGKDRNKKMIDGIIDDYLYRDIFSKFESPAYIFCFSAPSDKTFRCHIAQEKEYKGNRKNKEDYTYYKGKYEDMVYVFDYIKDRYTTLIFQDLEADDILSMLQHETDTFIFSHDKDLKQVPGFHFNMDHNFLEYIDEEEAFRTLICQILLGDSTDHIPGLHMFGEKALHVFKLKIEKADSLASLFMVLKEFTNKMGVLHGVDCFVEMWSLVSLKINRGNYLRQKYGQGFELIEKYVGNNE